MIKFLGIGGAFAIDLKNNAAYYKNNNQLLLIDCGETVFAELIKHQILTDVESLTILITHLHTDHIGSIGTLLFYSDKIGIQEVNIVYPNKEKINQLLELIGVNQCNYKIYGPQELQSYSIKEFPVKHSNYEAFSYLLMIKQKKIYYSGDSKTIPEEIMRMFKNHELDDFYQDLRLDNNSYHMSIEELNTLFPAITDRERIKCMHINNENEIEPIKANGYQLVKKIK